MSAKAKGHKKRKGHADSKVPIRAIIAIDPGESAGIAVVKDGKVLAARAARGDNWRTLAPAVIDAWKSAGCDVAFDQVLGVIEEGWTTGRGMIGQMTLCKRRGLAQAALEALGVTRFEFVYSSVWMNQYYGGIHGKDTGELSVEFSTRLLGQAPVNHDVGDAVNLAHWSNKEFCLV